MTLTVYEFNTLNGRMIVNQFYGDEATEAYNYYVEAEACNPHIEFNFSWIH